MAHRRIIRKERRGKALYKQKRPQSRTMAKVHEAYMEDLIWPHDVVGQKTVSASELAACLRVASRARISSLSPLHGRWAEIVCAGHTCECPA